MGSVISYYKCPQCGGTVFKDFNYRTQEEYRTCNKCGKGSQYTIRRNELGEAILDKNGKPIYDSQEWQGYGVAHYMGKKGLGVSYSLSGPLTEETKKSFIEDVEGNEEMDPEECYLTSWNDATKTVEAVYGKLPPNFEEEGDDV